MSPTANKYNLTVFIADVEFDLTSITIPSNVIKIGNYAFYGTKLTNVIFGQTTGWYVSSNEDGSNPTEVSSLDLEDPLTAATRLQSLYSKYWFRDAD